jgi:hypothetical protein
MTLCERIAYLRDLQFAIEMMEDDSDINIIFDFEEDDEDFLEVWDKSDNDLPEASKETGPTIQMLSGSDSVMLIEHEVDCKEDYGDIQSEVSSASQTSYLEEIHNASNDNNNIPWRRPGTEKRTLLPKVRNIFAIICSLGPRQQRIYPWGTANALNEECSDFRRLQKLVFESGKLVVLRNSCQKMSMALLNACEDTYSSHSASIVSERGNDCLNNRATHNTNSNGDGDKLAVSCGLLSILALLVFCSVTTAGIQYILQNSNYLICVTILHRFIA